MRRVLCGYVPDVVTVAGAMAWMLQSAVERTKRREAQALQLLNAGRADMQAACAQVESTVAVLLHMADYMAAATYDGAVRAATSAVRTTGQLLSGMWVDARTVLRSIDLLIVALDVLCSAYKGLFLCMVQLVVQGVLSVLDAATRAVAEAVRGVAQALHALLDALLAGANGAADVAIDGVNGVLGLFGKHVDAPTWDEPALFRCACACDANAARSTM